MRLWHYKLIQYLPNSQLIAQWRELNCIFNAGKSKINHILINYVKEYFDDDLYYYTVIVEHEMIKRNINFRRTKKYEEYFANVPDKGLKRRIATSELSLFPYHHTNRYLLQCFYNLQEKYDRGQKDFDYQRYMDLVDFVNPLKNEAIKLLFKYRVNIGWLIKCNNVEQYNQATVLINDKLTKEDFEFIKEVCLND